MDRTFLGRVFKEQQLNFAAQSVDITREVNLTHHLGRSKQVTTITGVRRCGKSTLLKQISSSVQALQPQILYATFDDPRFATFLSEDFEVLYETWLSSGVDVATPQYLFFDEVQNVLGWERWIDYFSKRPNTKIFITGSNASLLSSELSTLLTGRHQDLHLAPFSLKELVQAEFRKKNISVDTVEARALIQRLLREFERYGGFPRAYLEQNEELLTQYYADIIERDILRRLPRVKPKYILELGTILATETSRLFNRSNVARTLGLKDQVTVGKYTSAFVATYLYRELRAFSPSVRKQLRSLSKFYCVDHALARENGFRAGIETGSALELMVQMELVRHKFDTYYWHTKEGYEIDFLLVDKRKPCFAVQVAHSISDKATKARELRALSAARRELDLSAVYLVTMHESAYLKQEKIRVISFPEFALNGFEE